MCPYIWLLVTLAWIAALGATPSMATECSSVSSSVEPIYFPLSNCSTQPHGDVPVAESWGLAITLGEPPQELCVMPSMFTNGTFVPTIEVCTNDGQASFPTCTSRRGGLLDVGLSGAPFFAIPPNDFPPDYNWLAIHPNNNVTERGNVSLHLPADTAIPDYPLKIFRGGQSHNVGHLGLSQSSVLLQQLSDRTGVVKGFGLDAGSQSYTNPRDGHLIIGGYDKVRVGASFKEYNISDAQLSRRICPLQVVITELVLSRPGREDFILSSKGEQIPACIEPYDVLFRFPERTLRAFAQETQFANDTVPDPLEFYTVEPGITYPSYLGFDGSLKFTLDNDFVVEIPNEELVHPLRGIAPDGTKTIMTNTTEIDIFRYVALLDTAVLGKAFLSRVYLMVEYRSSGPIFRLAKSNSGNLPPNPVPFESDCVHSGTDQGSNTGKIVGIAVGTVVGACLFVGILAFYVWKYLSEKRSSLSCPSPEML